MAADVGAEARAEAERRHEAEHRTIYPDRRCAVGVKCSGIVLLTFGGAQLCTGHALAFRDADYETVVERLRAWVRQERAKGAA